MTVIDIPFANKKEESKEDKAARKKRIKEDSQKIESKYESIYKDDIKGFLESMNSKVDMFYDAHVSNYSDKTPYVAISFKDYLWNESGRGKTPLDEDTIESNINKVVKKLESLGFNKVRVDEESGYIAARMDKYDNLFENGK